MKKSITALLLALALFSPLVGGVGTEAAGPAGPNAVSLAPCVKASCTATIKAGLVYDRPSRLRVFAVSKTGANVKLLDAPVPAWGTEFVFVAVSPYGINTFSYMTYVMIHGYWKKDTAKTTPI